MAVVTVVSFALPKQAAKPTSNSYAINKINQFMLILKHAELVLFADHKYLPAC